eukprot:COSAG02_NODE_54916_length_293_cov_1.056701_1_plen_93_part_10
MAGGAAADDTAALRAFKASGSDPDGLLSSWTEGTSPCGEGWDSHWSGWVGVMCDARGGRVTYLSRYDSPGLTGSLGELTPLTQLTRLHLDNTG